MREMTGSGIFAMDNENEMIESGNGVSNPNNKTTVRICQVTATFDLLESIVS